MKKTLCIILVICLFSTFLSACHPSEVVKQVLSEPVSPDRTWRLTFDDPIDPNSIKTDSISVMDKSGESIDIDVNLSEDGKTIVVTPQTLLQPNMTYTLNVSDKIKDIKGKKIESASQLEFTVEESPKLPELQVFPQEITMKPGEVRQLKSSFSNMDPVELKWGVLEGRQGGIISAEGVYMAPQTPGTYHVIAKTSDNILAAGSVINVTASDVSTDLWMENADFTNPKGKVSAGSYLYLSVKVKRSQSEATDSVESTVRFSAEGRVVDDVPFYIKAGETYANVSTYYRLPEELYIGLTSDDKPSLHLTAVVDPDNELKEGNKENNTAASVLPVSPCSYNAESKNDGIFHISPSSLTAWSLMNEAEKDRVGAAQPMQKLRLKAVISSDALPESAKTGARLYVDNVLLDAREISIGSSGTGRQLTLSTDYQIPNGQTEPIEFLVELENGDSAYLTIPVIPWDFSIAPTDMTMVSGTNKKTLTPGDSVKILATVRSSTGVATPGAVKRVSVKFFLGEEMFDQQWISMGPNVITVYSEYVKVPGTVTDPLAFSVVVDPTDNYPEDNEDNNIATLFVLPTPDVPQPNPAFSVTAAGLSAAPLPLVPGMIVDLSASIYNESTAYLSRNLRVQFKINGQVIHDFTTPSTHIFPLQNKVVTRQWTVPADISSPPRFEVVLDPQNEFGDTATGNHQASTEFPIARADLSVNATDLETDPVQPTAGSTATFTAYIHNEGLMIARDSRVIFKLDGEEVGQTSVSVPGGTAASASIMAVVPMPDPEDIPSEPLTGCNGYIANPPFQTIVIPYMVEVDNQNLIPEVDETNNSTSNYPLTVKIPGNSGVVYVRMYCGGNPVDGLQVVLTDASGNTASALGCNGVCTFIGVPFGIYSLQISGSGYNPVNISGSIDAAQPTRNNDITVTANAQIGTITPDDLDGDGLSNGDEDLIGTGSHDPDTDNDLLGDSADESPLFDPEEPVFQQLQKPGMVRITRPVRGLGLDGWVDVYDVVYHLLPPSTSRSLSKTYDDAGTKKSDMSEAGFMKAVDQYFSGTGFSAYKVEDIVPMDIGVMDSETGNDKDPEFTSIYPGSWYKPTEYRFYYDFMYEYKNVSMKNTEEMVWPSSGPSFRYLLQEMAVSPARKNTLKLQFTDPFVTGQMYEVDEDHYLKPVFMYAYYFNNDFSNDETVPVFESMANMERLPSEGLEAQFVLPADCSNYSRLYLKITPAWAFKNGSGSIDYRPMEMSAWDLKSITRTVVIAESPNGESSVTTQELRSMQQLAEPLPSLTVFQSTENADEIRKKTDWLGIVNKPADPADEYTVVDCLKETSVQFKHEGKTLVSIYKLVNTTIKEYYKKKGGMPDVPEGHWTRSTTYNSCIIGLNTYVGLTTLITNGVDAYQACRDGEYVKASYYTLKAATGAAGTASAMAKAGESMASISGTKYFLASKKFGVGLAIATGVIEVSYDIYRLNTTKDPILQLKYKEKISSDMVDTALAAGGVIVAPIAAFQLTWTIGAEVYALFAGEDFAYSVAASPGKAMVFLIKYFVTEDVPSQMAEPVYLDARTKAAEAITNLEGIALPYMPIFIDPDL